MRLLFCRNAVEGLGLCGQRLPEFDLISIEVIDPGKAAVGFIHCVLVRTFRCAINAPEMDHERDTNDADDERAAGASHWAHVPCVCGRNLPAVEADWAVRTVWSAFSLRVRERLCAE